MTAIVKKKRLSREEQMIDAADVLSDMIGNKIFLQLVSVETGAGKNRFGEPGAVLIRNTHQSEIYLESIALQMQSETVYFPCHSYITAFSNDPKPRVFFSNKVLLRFTVLVFKEGLYHVF